MERFGFSYAGLSPFKPAYMVPKTSFTGDIPNYEYALYEGASQWRISGAAKVVAQLGEPTFQRSAARYTSHAQTPFERETEYAAIAISGRAALFGFPLGASYYSQGYWVYRSALKHVLRQVLPQPLIMTNAPASTEISVNYQNSPKPRYLVHIVNWSANRGTPRHPVFHEEPIPLTGVTLRLGLPVKSGSAHAVVQGGDLPLKPAGSGVEVAVPPVTVHEILVFEA